jgi:hypothetical protein
MNEFTDSMISQSSPLHVSANRAALVRVAWNVLLITLFALLACYVLFRLPFWFPRRQQLMSASYAFGFNNGVAVVGTAVLSGAVALYLLLLLRWREAAQSRLPIMFQVVGRPTQKSLVIAFAAVAVLYVGLTYAMYLYNVCLAPPLMWETRHLLHRTWLMDVYGLRPYTEVAAEYGPIITYAPLYTYWMLRPLGASLELAYFISVLLLNLAGVGCFYYVLSSAVMPARSRVVTFVTLAVAAFELYMGMNGVLLRFLFPFASLLLGHRAVARMRSHRPDTRYWAVTMVSILALLVLNILISPDTAVAFAIAWFGYGLLLIHREVRVLAVSVVALISTALLSWLFLPAAYYGTLLHFSAGANNWPLLPAPHLLFYFLTLFLIVPSLLAGGLQGDISGAAICGAFGLLCLAMAPGALGRCDPPHVLNYGMGAAMLLMIRLANISRPAFAAYLAGYAAVFIILMQVVNLDVYYQIPPKMLLSRDSITRVAQKVRAVTSMEHPDTATLSLLDRYPRLGLPFASFGDPAVERYVVSRGQLAPEYYVGTVGVYDVPALTRKLRDVGEVEYLFVPRKFATRALGNPCAGYLKTLSKWFLYPAKLPCRAAPLDPMTALKSFIADHYVCVQQIGAWSVMRRTSNTFPAQHEE